MKEIKVPFKITRPILIIAICVGVVIFGFLFIRNIGRYVTGKVTEGLKGTEEFKISELSQSPGLQKIAIEKETERRIQTVLDRILGPDKSIVKVSIELSPEIQNKEEIHTPKSLSTKQEEKTNISSEEEPKAKEGKAKGKMSAQEKLPGYFEFIPEEDYFIYPGYPSINEILKSVTAEVPASFKGETRIGTKATKEILSTNYALDKRMTETITPAGTIDKVAVFVLLDYNWKKGVTGKAKPVPRTEKEIQSYRALIEKTIGYNTERGDEIEIHNIPFTGSRPLEEMKERLVTGITIVLLLPLLYFIVRATLNFLQRRAQMKKEEIELIRKEEEAEKERKLKEEKELREKIQLHQEQVFQIGKGHPDICARIIRNWLT